MLIVIASAFRILVTFAIVLEVRGIFFFQIPWTTYGRSSSLNWNITTGLFLMSSPLYIVALPVLPFCMGYPEEICWTSFDMLNHASTTQKIVCSFELSLFSCLLTPVYQLIVKIMCAFVHRCLLLLWSVKPFHSGWLGETNSSTSSIFRIGSKQLYSADQILIQFLFCSTLECYHLYIKLIMGMAHHPMNSWFSDTLAIIIHFSASVLLQPEWR